MVLCLRGHPEDRAIVDGDSVFLPRGGESIVVLPALDQVMPRPHALDLPLAKMENPAELGRVFFSLDIPV
jgi:hypothetical protein